MTFEDHLSTIYCYSQRVFKEKLAFHHTNIKILQDHGISADYFYRDLKQVMDAVSILESEIQKYAKKDRKPRMNVFKLYYEYLISQKSNLQNSMPINSSFGNQKSTKRYYEKPIDPPLYGPDQNCGQVRYLEGITSNERVPDLAEFLMDRYNEILAIAYDFLKDTDIGREDCFDDITVYLSNETPVKIEPFDDDYCADQIVQLGKKTKGIFAKQDILKIINGGNEDRLMGEYFPNSSRSNRREGIEGPYIKIYYRNISYQTPEEYLCLLAMTLAHEYLHHLHHMEIGSDEFIRIDKHSKRVEESLADFFSVWYVLKHLSGRQREPLGKAVAAKRHDAWERRYPSGWPYSYALHYFPKNWFSTDINSYPSSIINKFIEIFSTISLDDAYAILVN